jgi:glycosyltransferase involved in cell wall biosynthesis
MRILQLLGRSTGGIGSHVGRLTTELRGLGHDVVVATDRSTMTHFGWHDARALWPFGSVRALARTPLDWHRIMRLASTVDIVHAHGQQAAVVAAVAVLRARPRPRLVVTLHNEVPVTGPGAKAVRWAIGRADLVTGASDDLVETARALGARRAELSTVVSPRVPGLLAEPYTSTTPAVPETSTTPVVPHASATSAVSDTTPTRATAAPAATDGSSTPEAARRRRDLLESVGVALSDDRPLVLTVSRIAPQKDLDTLVAAARALTERAAWVVVGGGDAELRRRLEAEVSGIPVAFVGERGDVETWLRAATVLVLTSRWEARALVVQEAMAAGVPVVVPEVGGLPGLVGDAGVLVPPGDASAPAAAVDELLRAPARRAALAAAGRLRARTWETPEDEARQWVVRYEALTGS